MASSSSKTSRRAFFLFVYSFSGSVCEGACQAITIVNIIINHFNILWAGGVLACRTPLLASTAASTPRRLATPPSLLSLRAYHPSPNTPRVLSRSPPPPLPAFPPFLPAFRSASLCPSGRSLSRSHTRGFVRTGATCFAFDVVQAVIGQGKFDLFANVLEVPKFHFPEALRCVCVCVCVCVMFLRLCRQTCVSDTRVCQTHVCHVLEPSHCLSAVNSRLLLSAQGLRTPPRAPTPQKEE
jgi:hypothetical protein